MKSATPPEPPERRQTIRQQMQELLRQGDMSIRDLSQTLGIGEKEAAEHLDHLARFPAGRPGKLEIVPSRCLQCDFVFTDRKRPARPGRCPRCKGSHLTAPLFRMK